MNTVSTFSEVCDAMEQFQRELPFSPELASRLGQAHAFYVIPTADGQPRFCFSKFLGYRGLSAESYLSNYKMLDGRNTEHALKPWFEEVLPGSNTYDELFDELRIWLAEYGKRPRGGDVHHTRIMVPKQSAELTSDLENNGDDLLQLLIAVAKTLPVNQRSILRSAL